MAKVGALVSLIWYVMGAEDRFLVRVYRDEHVKNAAALVAKSLWSLDHHPYHTSVRSKNRRKHFTGNSVGGGWDPSAPLGLLP